MTDPYRILGVSDTTDDDAVRSAYLAAIRECPPERDRLRFEQVRTAYETISSMRKRLAHALFDKSVPTLDDVLAVVSGDFQPRRLDERRLRRVLSTK